ncbi:hypothetical protein, partial [Pseudomonas asplenii]|uniref:hypothetical protein n=1 Tax=Pseudomonas asplenii TaxID=53407 RepID=UPI001E5F7F10
RWFESNRAYQTKSALLGGLEGSTERLALFAFCDVQNSPPQNAHLTPAPTCSLSVHPHTLQRTGAARMSAR